MSNKFKNVSVISTGSWVPSNLKNLSNSDGIYQVQINELVLMASIGIHDHEKIKKQRVSISLSIKAVDNLHKVNESIKNVVSYEMIIKKLKKMCSKGHIELLEKQRNSGILYVRRLESYAYHRPLPPCCDTLLHTGKYAQTEPKT